MVSFLLLVGATVVAILLRILTRDRAELDTVSQHWLKMRIRERRD